MIRALACSLLSFQTIAIVIGAPLLKVPKVYNALITTDQNLSPSRAIPVIQPVIHRTAIGYSPPFYYQPGNPGYGSEYVPSYEPNYEPGTYDSGGSGQSEFPHGDEAPDTEIVSGDEETTGGDEKDDKQYNNRCAEVGTKTKDQVPLSFYPNFRSMYYDPYLYGFNAYPAFLPPDDYYLNYRPEQFALSRRGSPPYSFGHQSGYLGSTSGPVMPQAHPKNQQNEQAKLEKKSERNVDALPPPVAARQGINRNN
ncbi:uncharacterized protein [Fopius arisanus]|uniref:Uncharacterized protein n=1 Tax=Fopius arisanus TaxID=64838 RepID=A0A9R1T011_9HYME|nr:PREDICTED: uncharacterized protein LOC105264709 [Fopius arisanus]XP_011300077.1 PREDICTED: uncharacterized protein LOC105264709 [Fopius arisanus]XP_011300078.1 PREDICTED: uncharacterized protein LOC105264709 [Fopius arisanus]XP_011300079.1 PREDICTED: uncharacterized protein LOC105264709 [Fopius arisanus]